VPVLASVAAILPAMWPDLPMPVTTMRPRQSRQIRQARANSAPQAGQLGAQALDFDIERLAADIDEVLVGKALSIVE
jgi:hypothetical protein